MNNTEDITRREFVKQNVIGTAVLAGASSGVVALAATAADTPHTVVGAMGAVFIPSKPGDPGYKDLEQYGITDYVIKRLLIHRQAAPGEAEPEIGELEVAETFNNAAKEFFDGKTFLELTDQQKEQYLVQNGSKITDAKLRGDITGFYRAIRYRVMEAYYGRNFPEGEVKRNAQGEPILKPGDTHQIMNPNTTRLVTGWDIAGFKGPPTWEEEEAHRAKAKKNNLPFWYEGDLITRNNVQAAPAIKTGDGHDYYDVIVIGGGAGGCIVGGRLAERGINPKTGDRLRVCILEAGDDWTIRDPGIRPGYGQSIRRRMITNLPDDIGPEGHFPGPNYRFSTMEEGFNNFKLFGGMSMHWGCNMFLPVSDDFQVQRDTSGVDWTFEKFEDAIQEVRELMMVTLTPKESWARKDHLWADVGRSMGYDIYQWPVAKRNPLHGDWESDLSRYDSKGTGLPWAYIGLNNGMKVIANAEVQKVVIEKTAGGRPVATGAIYKDKAGVMHEVRAARVIVACSALAAPLLLYRSGYGPRELLGDNLIVENNNIGNLDGDANGGVGAVFSEPIARSEGDAGGEGRPCWTTMKPRPWGELRVALSPAGGVPGPGGAAMQATPEFGWKHKEYMRNRQGCGYNMNIRLNYGAVPWKWRMTPDGRIVRLSFDEKKIDAVLKDANELCFAWYDKMALKPVKMERRIPRAAALRMLHHAGTARAGANRENSVCSSDFDCHDIDNLLFTASAVVPKVTWSWGMGPTATCAAYAWRRMLANHFSRGCSTKGFA